MDGFPINAPVNFFSDGGPVNLALIDQVNSVTWNITTNLSDEIIFGTPLSPDVLHLYPTGEVEGQMFRLRRGANKVTLDTDPALSASYTYNLPAAAPTGAAQVIASNGSSNQFYDVHAQNVIYVRKNPGPNEFATVYDAIASIPVFPAPGYPADTNRYAIYVTDGDYYEQQLVFPDYVFFVGISMQGVRLFPLAMGYPLISLSKVSGLIFCTIKNTDPLFPAVYVYNGGDYVMLHKIEMEGCQQGIYCLTDSLATDITLLYLEYVGTTDCFQYSLKCVDTNILGGFGTEASIENYFTYGHNDFGIIVDGHNSHLLSQASVLQGDGVGVALTIKNGANADIRGMYIEDWTVGIEIPNDPGVPGLLAAGILYENCGININILTDFATGHNDGYTEYTKTIVPKIAPFFITNKDQHIITVASKGADFTSVFDALAAIVDNSFYDRYTIYVGPGIYLEPPLVLKPYVTILGFFQTQCIIMATDYTQPLITGAGWASIDKLTLTGANPAFPPNTYPPYLIEYLGSPLGHHFRTDGVAFGSTNGCVHIGSSLGPCIYLNFDSMINMGSTLVNGFVVEDSGPGNYPIIFLVDGFVWDSDAPGFANLDTVFSIKSVLAPAPAQNIFCFIQDCSVGQVFGLPVGKCMEFQGAVFATIESCLFGGFATCLLISPSVEQTYVLCSSNIFSGNTKDVDIQSVTAVGTINISARIDGVFVVPGSNFGISIDDPSGGIAFTGTLYQGENWQTVTNITEQIQHGASVGKLNTPVIITQLGGLNISVSDGTGYVSINPPNTHLKYITWAAVPSITLTDNSFLYIFVDSSGMVMSSPSQPNFISNIILGTVKTYGGLVTYVQYVGRVMDNLASNVDETLRDVFGPIVKSGCIASPGSSLVLRAVAVSSGSYYLSITDYLPVSGDNVTMISYYNNGATQVSNTDVPLFYDNAGVLTAIPAGMWVKHSIYILTDLAGNTQYFLIYGQQLFATELTAQQGPIPSEPPFFGGNLCPVSGVIVTSTDPSSPLAASRFRDIRPTLSFRSDGVTASADHNSLLNLTVGNAHPQYFRVDGTSVMSGTMQLDGQNIVGVGGNLLNGVDITAHGSRHLPGGADALTTLAPVNIGTANSIGAAAAFSRSDHVHAHGAQTDPSLHSIATGSANGFMSSSDKTKLDNATALDVPSTLVARDGTGMSQFSELQLLSNSSIYTVSLKTLPLGFGGPNHNVSIPVPTTDDVIVLVDTQQTLTNKNLVDTSVLFSNIGDPSKKIKFDLSTITPATTRTYITPDFNTTLVGTDAGQSLTNKTIIGTTNTVEATALRSATTAVVVNVATAPTSGQVLTASSGTAAAWQTPTTGTVTSVGLSMPAEFSVASSPVTTSGTLTVTKATQSANTIYAGPTTGAAAAPTFRALATGDLAVAPKTYEIISAQLSVGGGATTNGYFPWNNAALSGYTTRTITAWIVPSSAAGKNLTLSVVNNGGATLGSITVNGGAAVGAIYTFTFTAPGADTRIDIVTSRTGGAGNNALINGITLELS